MFAERDTRSPTPGIPDTLIDDEDDRDIQTGLFLEPSNEQTSEADEEEYEVLKKKCMCNNPPRNE